MSSLKYPEDFTFAPEAPAKKWLFVYVVPVFQFSALDAPMQQAGVNVV